MQLGEESDVFTNSSGVFMIRIQILGPPHCKARILLLFSGCHCVLLKWDWDAKSRKKKCLLPMRERETKRREGDRERRTIKENSKDKKKYFLSMSNTVTEMVFYYKSPFTSYVLIFSILWPGYQPLLEQLPAIEKQHSSEWCHRSLWTQRGSGQRSFWASSRKIHSLLPPSRTVSLPF